MGQAVTPVATSITRYPSGLSDDQRTRLLWTGPKGPGRHNLLVRLSYDNGLTWPIERPLSEEFAAYSDIAVGSDGTVCVFWEREDREDEPGGTVPKALTLSRFDLAWLEIELD